MSELPFNRVLVANRGEIAVRIVRACRDIGVASVAVYADEDADSLHVRLADDAVALDGVGATATYLNPDKLVAAAKESGAQAVHPGYGFLAESADFAEQVEAAALTWIGPPASAIRQLGDKVSARRVAETVNAPLLAGTSDPVVDVQAVQRFAHEDGLPVAIKATYGGGGRGMRVAHTLEEIPDLFAAAVRESEVAFGRGEVYVERFLERARHVEVQILADTHGAVAVVGDRDCSLQRRHQKLVEEAPAPFLTEQIRHVLHESAAAICREVGYVGVGTVEYLMGPDGELAFLEVNTRLQVEHCVSEETSDIDLVVQQLRTAAGLRLPKGLDGHARRHAMEFRINAEDPAAGFLPSSGTLTRFRTPDGPGVRMEPGVVEGSRVSEGYDSLLAKVVITGADRPEVFARARRALDELRVDGVATVAPFLRDVVRHDDFTSVDGMAVHTQWIEQTWLPSQPDVGTQSVAHDLAVRVGGRLLPVRVPALESPTTASLTRASERARERSEAATAKAADAVLAPMQATVISVAVHEGQAVDAGDRIAVVEAMKMEHTLTAPRAGAVRDLTVTEGSSVRHGDVVCRIAAVEGAAD